MDDACHDIMTRSLNGMPNSLRANWAIFYSKTMTTNQNVTQCPKDPLPAKELTVEERLKLFDEGPVGWGPYVALIFTIVFFSGVFYGMEGDWAWLGAFDFTTLIGAFGKIGDLGTFVGKGGDGARSGFLFALSLLPSVMLALGVLEVVSHYGAIRAAHRLMSPFLKPVLGIPGLTGLALITDLQSTDAGAALTKGLKDTGFIDQKSLTVMCAWQYSGAGLVNNYFAIGSALFASCLLPVWVPLLLCLIMKFWGGVFVRIVLSTVYKKDFQ